VIAASFFDHPGILLLIVFVALIRFLLSKAKSAGQSPPAPPPPSRPISRGGETQTEEERVRRFLEALGQPPGTTPPKITRRREVPPNIFSPLPPLKTKPPPLPEMAAGPLLPPMKAPTARPVKSAATSFEVHDVARQISSEPVVETRRPAASRFEPRFKLGTPQDLRTAIILREIFGPPRSLQSVDLTS
jgi:hypothetical protein